MQCLADDDVIGMPILPLRRQLSGNRQNMSGSHGASGCKTTPAAASSSSLESGNDCQQPKPRAGGYLPGFQPMAPDPMKRIGCSRRSRQASCRGTGSAPAKPLERSHALSRACYSPEPSKSHVATQLHGQRSAAKPGSKWMVLCSRLFPTASAVNLSGCWRRCRLLWKLWSKPQGVRHQKPCCASARSEAGPLSVRGGDFQAP
mmetsp:Transcript_5992/g.10886  ORF Transcript_5992/g.10886 Transcript_5992/m.10886 type:complete len:203 (-) Transcript_5992:575-1183(-)